jgi:hypothetical protein
MWMKVPDGARRYCSQAASQMSLKMTNPALAGAGFVYRKEAKP